ncbi:uncharacterized protein MONOS_5275 [Monocercomonoides exilis]|uniref:uncharacterized protein n=1 Tax=Monocercomonoides exilis TaxID=2049356 RepID=UPI00355A0AC0|nr:hypothetical protein MONOS_5275 [Monocercomonoides exilis]|eukprot:MONOS_5275.1-p1 / transcript=MONOS_5275.1 / gene=MONOS_5275 / organism=Monocercomonoides_exilis_PA203 / gene_product=unspecified product / transcript_product=unspecified product / location=Mono_scaffold00151:100570-101616(-) / protein_length=349 / sequence_SO=supercontig / SO=protein_coding / is_pseudo=false
MRPIHRRNSIRTDRFKTHKVAPLHIERTQKKEKHSILPSSFKFSWVLIVNAFHLMLSHPLTSIVRTLLSKLLSASFTSSFVFSIPSLFTSCVTSISISQSMSSSSTTPTIISFSTQSLIPSAASSNRLLLRLLATRAALTAVVTTAYRLMVKKDLLHKISTIFETHPAQTPSSSPSMFISASLIQRLEVVGAAISQQSTPSALSSSAVQQTSEPQSTSLVSNVATNAQEQSGSSNAAADGANTTSVCSEMNASGAASGRRGELPCQMKIGQFSAILQHQLQTSVTSSQFPLSSLSTSPSPSPSSPSFTSKNSPSTVSIPFPSTHYFPLQHCQRTSPSFSFLPAIWNNS